MVGDAWGGRSGERGSPTQAAATSNRAPVLDKLPVVSTTGDASKGADVGAEVASSLH